MEELVRQQRSSRFDGEDLLGDGKGLVVTVLAGGRPGLLSKMLDSLLGVLAPFPESRVVAFLNQEDPASESQFPHHVEVLKNTSGVAPIGVGYAALARSVGDARWWLHIEDDWKAFDPHTAQAMLREAVWALEHHSDVIQVRLRFWKERVLARHMVTGRPIGWQLRGGHFPVAAAHWTFNPSLVRGTAAGWFAEGVDGEQDAQAKVHAQHPDAKIIQTIPGVFVHLGDNASLRKSAGAGPDRHGM